MVLKRKRALAPYFKVPQPLNPLTGQRAPIGNPVDLTRIAMVQVSDEDTHDNYVVCRLFDPECGKLLFDVPVAKTYGTRGTFPYRIGEVYPAAKPRTRLGDNAGVASTSTGHPADLDEEVEMLVDDDNNPVAWLLLDRPTSAGIQFRNDSSETAPAYAIMAVTGAICDDSGGWFLTVDKPSANFFRVYVVNGGQEVPGGGSDDSFGVCFDGSDGPVEVLCDLESVENGEELGPKPDQWSVTRGYPATCDAIAILDSGAILSQLHPVSPEWIEFTPTTGSSVYRVPAYSVMGLRCDQRNGEDCHFTGVVFGVNLSLTKSCLAVNGPVDVEVGGNGACRRATDRPVPVRFDTTVLALAPVWCLDSCTCGPWGGFFNSSITAASKVYPFLLGFTMVGTVAGHSDLVLVVQDFEQIGWCKAVTAWAQNNGRSMPYCTANPCDPTGTYVYDGSVLPEIAFTLGLPRGGDRQDDSTRILDPNVQPGNILSYKMSRQFSIASGFGTEFVATGAYLDDCIGTVKMWTGASHMPQGWREYSAMQERFPVGIKSGSEWAYQVGCTGGSKEHKHELGNDFGESPGSGGELKIANHLPPYSGITFIERYK